MVKNRDDPAAAEEKKGETLIITQDFLAKKKSEVLALPQKKTGPLGALSPATTFARSEERRGGNGCVGNDSSAWATVIH